MCMCVCVSVCVSVCVIVYVVSVCNVYVICVDYVDYDNTSFTCRLVNGYIQSIVQLAQQCVHFL